MKGLLGCLVQALLPPSPGIQGVRASSLCPALPPLAKGAGGGLGFCKPLGQLRGKLPRSAHRAQHPVRAQLVPVKYNRS